MPANEEKLKILVADDVDFFREVMCAYFQRTPADILTAASGLEAFDVALKQRPDLIYLDAGMPGLSGLDCCRKLKADVRTNHIPIVVIFTPGRDATVEEVQDCGCDGFLTKPFGKEEFLNLGHRFLFHIERRERRVSCQMTVDFVIAGRTFQGRGHDISQHGIYVEFRDELPPEKQVEAHFLLPTVSSDLLRASGRIAWVNQGFPRTNLKLPQGFGIEFQAMSREVTQAIGKYLELY